jgi:hypothetical protein
MYQYVGSSRCYTTVSLAKLAIYRHDQADNLQYVLKIENLISDC